MPSCIAFLRAVNVGGRIVKMDSLKREFEALGGANVETFIASGNVIFDTRARAMPALERRIEAALRAAFGFDIDTFVRSRAELAAIAASRPFAADRIAAARTFAVALLAEPPGTDEAARVLALANAIDDFRITGRELYWLSTVSLHESKFSNALLERMLKRPAAMRGMNTMQRMAAKYPGGNDAG